MSTIIKADLLNSDTHLTPPTQLKAIQRRQNATRVMVLALTLNLLVTWLVFALVRSQEDATIETRFHLDSADRVRALRQELQVIREVMQSVVSLYNASEKVERNEFVRFLQGPVGRHPWLQAIQWAPLVAKDERSQFETAGSESGQAGVQITELGAGGKMIPAAERDFYCPVTFMIPFEPNLRAYGYDLLSQSDRRQALWAARDLGEMRASASVTLVQGERGFLLVTPVYRANTEPLTIGARRSNLTGFCVGVFRIRTLVREALNSVNPAGVNLALFETTDEALPRLLDFHTAPGRPGDPPARAMASPQGRHHRTTMEVAGRTWQIICTPSPAYLAAFSRWQSWSVLAGGAALTAFLVLPFVQHRRFSDSLQERVARRTKQLARAYQDLEDEIKVRNHAELALRRSQQQLQAILDNTTAVVYVKDRQGRYLLINERYKWLFQLTEDDIIGRTDYHIFPPEVADDIHANDLKVLAAEAPLELEEVVPGKQGDPRTYISIKFPLRDESGAACAVCGISTDITDRKRMEEALRASQQRYDLIINGIKDGIWDWNLLTNEVYFSPQWKSMLGYAEEEVENNFAAWQKLLHPDDAERAALTIQAFLENHHQVYELEHRLRHRDGTYRCILARGVALRDARGQPVRLAGSHVDLTEHKRSEEQLRAVNTALEERQRELTRALDDLEQTHAQLQSTQLQLIQAEKLESIGKLAAGVAHEVKNPLQTMLMGLTYLEERFSRADEEVKLTCADMRAAINRADSIVRGLLQMSGNPQLNLSSEDINAVLDKVLTLVNYSLDATRITVVRRFDPAMPRVSLDLGKMEQVFINLLTNAIHAQPQGGTIFVRTFAEADGPGGTPPSDADSTGRVVVQIQDTGPGIPPEHLDRLFTPFFTTKQNGLGTGLGLSVTKSIVELHGGRIELGNAPGGGALATVTLQTDRRNTYEKSTHTVHR